MNSYHESEPHTLMEHFFRDKHAQSPRVSPRGGDLIDRCMCTEKSNSIASYYLNRSRRERLVVYVRVIDEVTLEEKIELIKEYCAEYGYQIAEIFTDVADHPSFGFKAAFDAMQNADGMITVDLNQFVSAHGDRIRELRPLIHHFFCQGGKHLITINDGIDTGTEVGQQNAIDLISANKLGFEP